MDQRVSLITLGVSDLTPAVDFYQCLGWHGQEVDETVFYQLGGLGLVLWSYAKLADDAGLEPTPQTRFRGVVLAQNVREKPEVDAVMGAAQAAGGTVVRAPAGTFYGGYAGYFADPDGHVWEVAYNPGFPLHDDGSLTIPDSGPYLTTKQTGRDLCPGGRARH